METSDSELVEAACNGDVSSFGHLYDRHYRMAVGIAYSRLSDHHLAEDAAQEAFSIACQKLASLKKTDQFASWLGTICRRVATKMKKKKLPEQKIIEEEIPENIDATKEKYDNVHKAVASLSSQAREVILLNYFSGLSYEKIGEALGISTQAVHGRLQRARNQLANRIIKE